MTALHRTVDPRHYVTPSTPQRIHKMLESVIQVHNDTIHPDLPVQCCTLLPFTHIVLLFHIYNEHAGRGSVSSASFFSSALADMLVFLVYDQTPRSLLRRSRCCTLILKYFLHEPQQLIQHHLNEGVWRVKKIICPCFSFYGKIVISKPMQHRVPTRHQLSILGREGCTSIKISQFPTRSHM